MWHPVQNWVSNDTTESSFLIVLQLVVNVEVNSNIRFRLSFSKTAIIIPVQSTGQQQEEMPRLPILGNICDPIRSASTRSNTR